MELGYHENLLQYAAATLLVSEGLPADALLRLRLTGRSMRPSLLPGDLLTVSPVDLSKLCRGDVLVVRRADGFVSHRLITFRQGKYWLKGDGGHYLDQPILGEDIFGFVKQVKRDGKVYDYGARPLIRLNRFLGWLGMIEVRLRAGRLFMPLFSFIKHMAVAMVYLSGTVS